MIPETDEATAHSGTTFMLPASTVNITPMTITQPGGTVTKQGKGMTIATALRGSCITESISTVTATRPGTLIIEPAAITTAVTQPGVSTTLVSPPSPSGNGRLLQNISGGENALYPWVGTLDDLSSNGAMTLLDGPAPSGGLAFIMKTTLPGVTVQLSQCMTFCGGTHELSLRFEGTSDILWTVTAVYKTMGPSPKLYQMAAKIPRDHPDQRLKFPTTWYFPPVADGVGILTLKFTPATASDTSPAMMVANGIQLSRV
jgi:hypothetical protein